MWGIIDWENDGGGVDVILIIYGWCVDKTAYLESAWLSDSSAENAPWVLYKKYVFFLYII